MIKKAGLFGKQRRKERQWLELDADRGVSHLENFDFFLMGVVVVITVFGLAIFNSSMSGMYSSESSVQMAMIVQIVGFVLGVICAVIISFIDYIEVKRFCMVFYIFNIFMMLLVYTPLGIEQNDSRAWLDFKITTYQPSELMKLAMIILLAKLIEEVNEEGFSLIRGGKILMAFLIPLGLVILQKDIGQALVYIFTFMTVIFVGGMSFKYIGTIVGAGALAVPFVWKFYINDTRRARLLSFMNPDKYWDESLQLRRSLAAIGSGGIAGQGLGEGEMNTGKKILVKMSDSVFSVLGEELGFIGCVLLILLFTIMLVRMIFVSSRARDVFGKCVGAGIFAMFAFNIFENIGMNLGLMPITGIPLPFVSKGGSAMLTNYIAIGFLLSVSMRKKKSMFEE